MLPRTIAVLLLSPIVALAVGACASSSEAPLKPTGTVPAGTTEAETPVMAADLCTDATHRVAGNVTTPDLVEISGLAASRTQDVLWAHNDSGDTPRVFAMSLSGEALATYEIRGAEAVDWEDMAIGPGPESGLDYLYLGDIGDNASIRTEIVVYRGPEPTYDPASSLLAIEAERIVLKYPDGAHDAEILLVDPLGGDIYIITKNIAGGPSSIYRAAAPVDPSALIVMEKFLTEIDFAALAPEEAAPPGSGPLPEALPRVPTGGDISPDGSMIAIRTYGAIWLWQREGHSITASFENSPCEAPSEVEMQGEAIAFRADGRGYFTASEGTNVELHEFALD